jgi:hypothetical protein
VDVLLLACGGRGNDGKEGENDLKEVGKCGKEGLNAVKNKDEEKEEERGEVNRGQFLEMEAEVRGKELSAVVSCNGNKVYV